MENNDELIEVFFNLGQENIDWIRRKTQKNSIQIEKTFVEPKIEKTANSNLRATVRFRCQFCKIWIENKEYHQHLQNEHPVEYENIQLKKKTLKKNYHLNIRQNSNSKLRKSKIQTTQIKVNITEKKSNLNDNLGICGRCSNFVNGKCLKSRFFGNGTCACLYFNKS